MNGKTAKKLRRKAEKLALQTSLAANEKGLTLRYPNTVKRIANDLKNGKLLADQL